MTFIANPITSHNILNVLFLVICFCTAFVDIINEYSTMFTQHRVERNQLSDLNIESLKHIGVTAVGDILKMLRHAKQVSSQVLVYCVGTYSVN